MSILAAVEFTFTYHFPGERRGENASSIICENDLNSTPLALKSITLLYLRQGTLKDVL